MTQKLQALLGGTTETTMKRLQAGKDGTSRKDVLSYLIEVKDPETGKAFKSEDVIIESSILLLAGGDTIAIAVRMIFCHTTRE